MPAVSDIIVSSATGELVMIYAAPVYNKGQLVGVIYGRRNGNALSVGGDEIAVIPTNQKLP